MNQQVCLCSLEFQLSVTKIHPTNLTFTFDGVFGLGDDLVCAFFLALEFGIIFEFSILENDGYGLGISIIGECVIPKSCRLKRTAHLTSSVLIIIRAGQFFEGEFRLLVAGFTHCGAITGRIRCGEYKGVTDTESVEGRGCAEPLAQHN